MLLAAHMQTEDLLAEIRGCFPPAEMPSKADLRFHPDDCDHCRYLSEYLDERRGLPVDAEIIWYVRIDLDSLSAKGWSWILPHYLTHCLTTDDEALGREETGFLIFYLSPRDEFSREMQTRLSGLSAPQIRCVVHFLEWLQGQSKWIEYCPDEIARAIQFVTELASSP